MTTISLKVLAQLAIAALAAILSILQIIDWFGRPNSRVEASVSFGSIEFPPDVIARHETLKKLHEGKWIESIPFDKFNKNISPDDNQGTSIALTNQVRDSLRQQFELEYNVSKAVGFWRATVENTGSQSLSNVRLLLPGSFAVSIERPGTPKTLHSIDTVVEIGAIQPQEIVEIVAWSKTPPRISDSIRLTHSTGVGDLEFLSNFGAPARFVQRNEFLVIFALMIVTVFFLLSLINYLMDYSSKSKEGTARESE